MRERERGQRGKSSSTMVTPSGEQMFELRQGRCLRGGHHLLQPYCRCNIGYYEVVGDGI